MRRAIRRTRLAFEVLATYPRARWLMGHRELPAVLSALRPRTADGDGHVDAVRAARLGMVVTRVLTPLPMDSRCLIRALVLTRMLDRRWIPSTLVIGVQPGEQLKAHAWVEVAGQPVLPAGDFERLGDF